MDGCFPQSGGASWRLVVRKGGKECAERGQPWGGMMNGLVFGECQRYYINCSIICETRRRDVIEVIDRCERKFFWGGHMICNILYCVR